MSHTQLGEINIYQAQSILIVWSWGMKNDGSASLWASHHVELKHDIGYGTRSTWNPFSLPRNRAADETWVEWKPGEGMTTDVFDEHFNSQAVVAPDRSGSISGNFDAAWTGSMLVPGPGKNRALREFWDKQSDDGAEFHLKLSLYQQDSANLRMSQSKRLDEHEFSFLFGITTKPSALRILPIDSSGSEQPSIGIYTQ